jgi:heat-inducible transcriptional repressor
LKVLSMVDQAEGVQIFIGANNALFNLAGCSMIVSSFRDGRQRVVGALGVIGPTRINYARIIPMVDYTAKLVSRLIG